MPSLKPWIVFVLTACLTLAGCIGIDRADDTVLSVEATSPRNSLFAGDTMTLRAQLVNPFGDRFAGELTWISSNPAVATLSETGLFTALTTGQTTVTASHKGLVSNELFISVVADTISVAEVRVTANQTIIGIGGMVVLNAEALNGLGQPVAGQSFTWRSENPQIASVAEEGMVTGVATGKTRIFAETNGISSPGFEIEVAAASRMGTFAGLNGYQVRGTAFLENSAAGPVVRLGADFQSSNGPGLYVYLSNSANSVAGGVEVGRLRKNSGEDTYALPAGVGLTDYNVVVILCKPFSIPFGSATLN